MSSLSRIQSLAREVPDLARNAPHELASLVAGLVVREQAELALLLPAQDRLELLLHVPKPMQLVRALPDGEFYLTVREVGPSDGLPLLSLASASQLTHLLDLECWRGDRFDADRAGAWVALLLEAGEPAILRFLHSADDALLALLFRKWIQVTRIVTEDGTDTGGTTGSEGDSEHGFASPDGYHRFSPTIPEHGSSVRKIAEIFMGDQQDRYMMTLWSALQELPSELEEQSLHWRRSRLEEHGFPNFEEALSVYAPPTGSRARPEPMEPSNPESLWAPRSPLRLLNGAGILIPTMDRLSGDLRDRLLHEIASLANHLLIADLEDPGDPTAHRTALEKAASYIEIGLALRGARDQSLAAHVLRQIPILELFREGHGVGEALQARAVALVRRGWASIHPRGLSLLDAPIRQRVKGLLEPRPLFFDATKRHDVTPYRHFHTLDEIEETRAALELAEVVGRVLLERLALDPDPGSFHPSDERSAEPLRFSTVFLTALAWHEVRHDFSNQPLPPEVVSEFLRAVFPRDRIDPAAPRRALDACIDRLAREASLTAPETTAIRRFGFACLLLLTEECGTLDPGLSVDPRFVSCLLIA